jgi:thiopurine S-methyltransferase
MDKNFWIERWKKKEIGFHLNDYHDFLKKHGEIYFKDVSNVFIPLCGKSKDILWFYHFGKTVVGIELSDIACREFFLENHLQYNKSEYKNFQIYHTLDKKIYLINGDFFELNKDVLNFINITIQAVYDRASLIALPFDLRKQYVKHMFRMLNNKIKYFLITMEFEPIEKTQKEIGPPFSVTENEIKNLFEGYCTIKKIEERSIERKNAINSKEILYFMEKI